MRSSDEMYEWVVARMQEHEQLRQQRLRTVRRIAPVCACFVFAVIGGLYLWHPTQRVPTAPEEPVLPELTGITERTATSETAAQTAYTSASGQKSAANTALTSTSAVTDVSAVQTEYTTVTAAAPVPQTTAVTVQTTHIPETATATTAAALPESACSDTAAADTQTVPSYAEPVQTTVMLITESTTAPATEDLPPVRTAYPVIGGPDAPEGTAPVTTEPELPALPGFDVSWDTADQRLWHIRCTEPADPSPEQVIPYTVHDDAYRVLSHLPEQSGAFAGMYAVLSEEKADEYSVMQYSREEFSITCTPLKEAESCRIGDYPCIMGRLHGTIILYWDDGCYTFKMTAYNSNYELAQQMAAAFVQAE